MHGSCQIGSGALTTGSGRHLAASGWMTFVSPGSHRGAPLPSKMSSGGPGPHATHAWSYRDPTACSVTGPRAICLSYLRKQGTRMATGRGLPSWPLLVHIPQVGHVYLSSRPSLAELATSLMLVGLIAQVLKLVHLLLQTWAGCPCVRVKTTE
jgi:hypothetical protein